MDTSLLSIPHHVMAPPLSAPLFLSVIIHAVTTALLRFLAVM